MNDNNTPRYRVSRLNTLIATGKVDTRKVMALDCYNQSVHSETCPTIKARVADGNLFISEKTSD